MKKICMFLSIMMCAFVASSYAQPYDGGQYDGGQYDGGQYDGGQQYDGGYAGGGYAGDGYASGDANCGQPCAPSEKPMNDCYCLYCKYEPCYYNKWHCNYCPKYTYKKCCRYVPQYYQK